MRKWNRSRTGGNIRSGWRLAEILLALPLAFGLAATAWAEDPDDNPPGPIGGQGTNWENPPGLEGGPGASPDRRVTGRHHRRHHDPDDNPPGQLGGPGTNWENRPGPQGGPGASPDRRRAHRHPRQT